MVKIHHQLWLITTVLLLASCGPTSTTVKPEPATSVNQELESKALGYLQSQQYSNAAREYLRLASEYPEQANVYNLKAATAWFKDGNDLQAEKALQDTNIDQDVFPIQALQKNIIAAKISNYRQQPSPALELLQQAPTENTPAGIRTAYHQTRANAYDQLQQPNSYLLEMLSAFAVSNHQNLESAEVDRFWQVIKTRSPSELDSLAMVDSAASESWLALAAIEKKSLANSTQLQADLAQWQVQYPDHPANLSVIPNMISNAERFQFTEPKHIALILPLSDRYQQAGEAIRDGFVSAWMERSVTKPELKIYDSTTGNINQIYQQAVDQGANVVVGPLLRENILELVNSDNILVSTVFMNYLQDEPIAEKDTVLPGINLFQIGLSPEQEARQIAREAYADGHYSALVMTPANDKGEDIYAAFEQEFVSLGGVVLERSGYDNSSNSYIRNIRALLNSDISKQRASTLQSALNLSLENQTRSRQDADMIFLYSRNIGAKQIVPMLYFEQQGRLPIYATSDIHTKLAADEDNTDINNVIFTDIPWLLSNSVMAQNMKMQFEQHWPRANYFLYRLYALGHDTYSVLNDLPALRNSPDMNIPGLSGDLGMDENGRVLRTLTLGTFKQGQAQRKR